MAKADTNSCLFGQVLRIGGFQGCPLRSMLLIMVSSLHMHAVSATFLGLPADSSRLVKVPDHRVTATGHQCSHVERSPTLARRPRSCASRAWFHCLDLWASHPPGRRPVSGSACPARSHTTAATGRHSFLSSIRKAGYARIAGVGQTVQGAIAKDGGNNTGYCHHAGHVMTTSSAVKTRR